MFDRPFRSGFLTTTLMSLCLGTAGIAARAETTVTAVMHAPLRAVEAGVEEHVPQGGDGGEHQRQCAHVAQRAIHQPG